MTTHEKCKKIQFRGSFKNYDCILVACLLNYFSQKHSQVAIIGYKLQRVLFVPGDMTNSEGNGGNLRA